MRKALLLFFFLPALCAAQENLVPNGVFEEYTHCPNNMGRIYFATNWSSPTGADADYFNVCSEPEILYPPNELPDTLPRMGVPINRFGNQLAREGYGYAGIFAFRPVEEVRDYIQVELTEPLVFRVSYLVSFYASIAETSQYAVNKLGAYLSEEPISSNDYLPLTVNPQVLSDTLQIMSDTLDWVLISDTVVSPTGGERFLTIGNFSRDYEVNAVFFNPQGQRDIAYYYIDDVSVVALDSVPSSVEEPFGSAQGTVKVWPNPATDVLNISGNGQKTDLRLFDVSGREVKSPPPLKGGVGGGQYGKQIQGQVDISTLPTGVYILELTNTEGRRATERIIKIGWP